MWNSRRSGTGKSKMKYPKIKFADTNTFLQQYFHFQEELREVQKTTTKENFYEELADLEHSLETLIRVIEREEGVNFEEYRDKVIDKNYRRGYYEN